MFLDQTLQGMIQRFEDEYPETRLQPNDTASISSSTHSSSPPLSTVPTLSTSVTDAANQDSDDDEPKALRSRHNSDVNLASRSQMLEEGEFHRFSHRVRTEIINPSRPTSSHMDHANVPGSLDDQHLPQHILALRNYLFNYSGDEIRRMTESQGWDKAFDSIVENAEELKRLEADNPEEFARFRDSQIAALKNQKAQLVFDAKWKDNEVAVED